LSDRAYVSIKEAILTLKIKPGQLVAIGDLADQLRISRTPVRDALLRLEKEGLVSINPRKGAYATPISADDIEEIFELRIVLEGYAARVAVKHLTAQDQAQMRDLLNASEAAFLAGDERRAADLGRQMHDVMVRAVNNRRLESYLDNLDAHYTRLRRFAVTLPGRFQRSHEQHKAILAAVEHGDGETAGRIMEDHLASVRDDVRAHMDMWIPHLEGAGNGKEEAL
jgi:GntR family transcriptional regulator, rspAB operon transcriptional repressor